MEVAARMVNVLIGRVTLQGVFSLKLFRFSLVHIFVVLSYLTVRMRLLLI